MNKFENTELKISVEIVELKQRHAARYWEYLQTAIKEAEGRYEFTGPIYYSGVLAACKEAEWFVDSDLDIDDLTPAQARWMAEELGNHLLELSKIPNA
jgi:hypothetical protein